MGHQSWSGQFRKEKNPHVLTGIQTPDHPACSAISILTILSWLFLKVQECYFIN